MHGFEIGRAAVEMGGSPTDKTDDERWVERCDQIAGERDAVNTCVGESLPGFACDGVDEGGVLGGSFSEAG